MMLEDGDSQYGRFATPSGVMMKSFSAEAPLPSEKEVKVHYHGSVRKVVDVFSTFDEQKREILRTMKFHGVLNLAKFPDFDLYFCLWLMGKVECSRCSIRVRGSQEIPIRDIDVGNILDLPWDGEEMLVEKEASSETVSQIMQLLRFSNPKANLSVSYFEEILVKDYGGIMSKAQIDAFKIAAVIFSMSNVLCTGGNPKSIPLGLLKFLTVPDDIQLFNWSLLLRRYMVSWCHLVQQQIRMKAKSITIGGCFLLPMVTYLDNILLGSESMLQYEYPRAGAYSLEKMSSMIAADTTMIDAVSLNSFGRVFGKSQLKKEKNVCYGRWLVDHRLDKCRRPKKRKSENLDNLESSNKKKQSGLVAKLFLSAANKANRSQLMKSAGLRKKDTSQKTYKQVEEFADSAVAKMDAYLKKIRTADTIASSNCSEFFKELQAEGVLHGHKIWFYHSKPYPIKIDGTSMAAQLLEGGRYSTSVCDAIIRDQVQIEDIIFAGHRPRERHLMPASFIECYRKRNVKLGLEDLRIFFAGDHLKYDVTSCIQINMPVSSRRKWSCYSWNLQERTLTVLDPYLMKGPVSLIKLQHEKLVTEINDALFSCLKTFFPAYCIEMNDWTTIYRNDISDNCKWCDTGVYSMHYVLKFNTDKISDEINYEDDFVRRWESLWRIMSMDGNEGEKPQLFRDMSSSF